MARPRASRTLLAAGLLAALATATIPAAADAAVRGRRTPRLEAVERAVSAESWFARITRFVREALPSSGGQKEGAVIIGTGLKEGAVIIGTGG